MTSIILIITWKIYKYTDETDKQYKVSINTYDRSDKRRLISIALKDMI